MCGLGPKWQAPVAVKQDPGAQKAYPHYAHLARESVHEAAARIADSIAADVL